MPGRKTVVIQGGALAETSNGRPECTGPAAGGGKDAGKAKQIELDGWAYPKRLAGRVFGMVVHGDVAGVEAARHALADWLRWMGLREAGSRALLDRYIGYYKPYATSHDELDRDVAVQAEARNVARAVAAAVADLRRRGQDRHEAAQTDPRPK